LHRVVAEAGSLGRTVGPRLRIQFGVFDVNIGGFNISPVGDRCGAMSAVRFRQRFADMINSAIGDKSKGNNHPSMSVVGQTKKYSKRADIFRSFADNRHPRQPLPIQYGEPPAHTRSAND
jgi:hypothetical protein